MQLAKEYQIMSVKEIINITVWNVPQNPAFLCVLRLTCEHQTFIIWTKDLCCVLTHNIDPSTNY